MRNVPAPAHRLLLALFVAQSLAACTHTAAPDEPTRSSLIPTAEGSASLSDTEVAADTLMDREDLATGGDRDNLDQSESARVELDTTPLSEDPHLAPEALLPPEVQESEDFTLPADLAETETTNRHTIDVAGTQLEILFKKNQFRLDGKAKSQLRSLARSAKADRNLKVTISGHADARGSRKYNYRLSRKRAEAVSRYLHRQGVAQDQIATESFGKERLRVSGRDPQSHAQNRRVEIRVQ